MAKKNIPTSPATMSRAIKQIRETKKLSMREIAKRAGVTASLISQIENGRVSPSVETLFALATAMQVPVAHFFAVSDGGTGNPSQMLTRTDRRIIRKLERRTLSLETGIVWESLTNEETSSVRFIEILYPPGGRSAKLMLRHTGRDFLVVMEGEITVQLEFQNYTLKAGDSMWFDAIIPHQFCNESSTPTRLISVTVDPFPTSSEGRNGATEPEIHHPQPERVR